MAAPSYGGPSPLITACVKYLPKRCSESLLITKFIHHSFLSLNLELIALVLRATMRRQHSAAQSHVIAGIASAWRHRKTARAVEFSFPSRFLQGVSIACYAERCISHSKSVRLSVYLSLCLSVCPSVRHTLALSQNDSSYDHGVFTGG